MRKIITFSFIVMSLVACKETVTDENPVFNSEAPSTGTVESIAKRHIESKLSIPGTEKYSYHIYKANIDSDDKLDAIVTVNRKQFALEEATKSSKTAKNAETGFVGNYNYIFYYDGATQKMSNEVVFPSNALAELKVNFENITSEEYKDVIIDYRIMGASYKDFYTLNNGSVERFFQWKNYSGLEGLDETEAFYFKYDRGTRCPFKDILVMKAKVKLPATEFDPFTYEPELIKSDELAYRFFFHTSENKYMTLKK
jgi:hypothetical protein